MGINEILKISTQILQVSDSLYEYIKISNEHDKIIEIDKVEQIKELILNLNMYNYKCVIL